MFLPFFAQLRAHRVPVSLREYLTFLEGMSAGLVTYDVEGFYYLARAAMVKDERNLDKFDRAFGVYFKGLENLDQHIEALIPEERLRKEFERSLSDEERAKIESLGGLDKLIEEFKKRLEEQKDRHQGGSKWIGTAGTSPFGAYGYNPEGVRIGQDRSRHKRAVKVGAPRTFRDPGEACCRGIGVTGGAFRGLAAFNEEEVLRLRGALDPDAEDVDGVLLVLENPVPDEIPLILSVDALLASRGGSTAHAAVAVNGIDDKPFSAVLGVSRLKVRDGYAEMLGPDGQPRCTIRPGDIVSIHGQTGEVFAGSKALYA